MDTVKSTTGLGDPKAQSGEEPLSGKQGKGTAGEPYDQGNSEGRPRILNYLPLASLYMSVNPWIHGIANAFAMASS